MLKPLRIADTAALLSPGLARFSVAPMPPDDPPPVSPLPPVLSDATVPTSSTPPAESSPADDALAAAVAARGEATAKSANHALLLATVVLFVLLGGFSWGWESVVFVALAVAFHELGHVFAMRGFGYKNVRMLFIPLFGGLATGEPRELDATKNALVALAGPAFGLLTAAVAVGASFFLGPEPWLARFAWVSFILNAFNLLPFVPLDGGQVANETLFSRYPVLELIFRLIAICGLGTLAWQGEMWILGALVVLMLIGTPLAHRRARIIRDARRDPSWQTRSLDGASAGLLREMVARQFPDLAPSKYEKALPDHVHGLWLGIRKRFPGPGRTAALLAAYLFTSLVLAPALGFFLARYLPNPAF